MIKHSWVLVSFTGLLMTTGCASLTGADMPDTVMNLHDPNLGREYLLYRPVTYSREQVWPLVIACHGSTGDSPAAQIKLWRALADKYGFLVAAPQLMGKGAPDKVADDERHILSVLGHVRAGQSVSDDRILMYGQGANAYTALAAAVGRPDDFRAIALSEPRFQVEELIMMNRPLDPYQPLYIRYKISDLVVGKQVQTSVDWLRSNGANMQADTHGGRDQASNLQRVVEFYQHVIRTEPWIRIRAAPTGNHDKMEISFDARSTIPLTELHWIFGDGAESTEISPVHHYIAPSTYAVQLRAKNKKNTITRSLNLRVPPDGASWTPTKVP